MEVGEEGVNDIVLSIGHGATLGPVWVNDIVLSIGHGAKWICSLLHLNPWYDLRS